jgi:hypothetical protein
MSKFKKEKRKRMQLEGILSSMMGIARQHGYEVRNPQELPGVLREIMAGEPLKATGTDGISLQPDARHHTELHVTLEVAPAQPDEWGFEPEEQPQTTERPAIAPPNPIDDEMMEQYQAGLDKVMARVEQNGVRYKNSGNPEVEGRRMAPHPSAAPKTPPRPAGRPQGAPPAEDDWGFDDADFGIGDPDLDENDFQASDDGEVGAAGPDDEMVNSKTGLSLAQQRNIIAKVTGKVPPAPQGGRPNTLKQ